MNKYIFLLLLCIGCAERPTIKYRAKLITPHGKVYKTINFNSETNVYLDTRLEGQRLGEWNRTYMSAPIGWLIEYEQIE